MESAAGALRKTDDLTRRHFHPGKFAGGDIPATGLGKSSNKADALPGAGCYRRPR